MSGCLPWVPLSVHSPTLWTAHIHILFPCQCLLHVDTGSLFIYFQLAGLSHCCCSCAAVKVMREYIEDWMKCHLLNWFISVFSFQRSWMYLMGAITKERDTVLVPGLFLDVMGKLISYMQSLGYSNRMWHHFLWLVYSCGRKYCQV